MSKFDHKKVMPRFSAIAIVMSLLALAVVTKSFYIMTAKREYWLKVAERQKKDSVTVKPNRGNILSCTGQLMASSLPEFKVFMECQAGLHLPLSPQDLSGEEHRRVQAQPHRRTCQGKPTLACIRKAC